MSESGVDVPSRAPEPVVSAEEADEMLAELYQRFHSRSRGAAGVKRARRPKTPKTAPKRSRGFDWSLIYKMEQAEAAALRGAGSVDVAGASNVADASNDLDASEVGEHDVASGGRAVDGADTAREAGAGFDGYISELAARAGFVASPGMGEAKTGPGPSRRDPRLLASVADTEITERGWAPNLAVGALMNSWDKIAGDLIAAHTKVESFEDGRLVVRASQTSWAQALRLELPTLMSRIDETVGGGLVQSVSILGPKGPSWGHGPLRVPGRGRRDTYG